MRVQPEEMRVEGIENYSFVLQNSYSLHPVAIYNHNHKNEDLIVYSLCIVSDDLGMM